MKNVSARYDIIIIEAWLKGIRDLSNLAQHRRLLVGHLIVAPAVDGEERRQP